VASGTNACPSHERPRERDENLVTRSADLTLDLGHAAEQEDHDTVDGLTQHEADRGVAQLMREHAQSKQHCENERVQIRQRAAETVDQLVDNAVVRDGDECRDKHPGRCEIERNATEASHR
jgi:hypothetical protein